MASRLRTPTLTLTGLSMCLCLAIIGTAGRSLAVYNDSHSTNAWLLPIWPNHFDLRELDALIGTSAGILLLNAVLAAALLVPSLPANLLVLISALLSTFVSIISVAFSTVLNTHAPKTDTLQTWTCRWSRTPVVHGQSAPDQFHGLCHKTRFALYTTIPVLVIQVLLLCVGVWALVSPRRSPQRGGHQDLEKTGQQGHQLRNLGRHNVSFETESLRSYQDSARILGVVKM